MRRLIAAMALGIGVFSSSAYAASCKQEASVYSDEDSAYQLRFIKAGDDAGNLSNRFTISVNGLTKKFDGWVTWDGEPARPQAIITYQCPAGDITGEELDRCKVWQGIVYSVFPDGAVDLLPPGSDDGAPLLLLPDFGRTLRNSSAWNDAGLKTVPWDLMRFENCESTGSN